MRSRPDGRRRRPQVSPAPRWLTGLGALGIVYLVVPLVAMAARTPWDRFATVLAQDSSVDALWLSLRTCLAAVLVDVVVGVPLAVLLARRWRAVTLVRVLVALPLSLPPVVAGIALLSVFGRRGLMGPWLESAGLQIAFSTSAVIMAQVFVSLPFLVITLEAALRARPYGLEETAAALGAGPSRVLATITVPMVAPGLARGTALALARCLGEFGATLTFAGSLQGTTRTLPLQVYLARESDSDAALVLGMVLVLLAAAVVAITEWPHRRNHPQPVEAATPDPVSTEPVLPGRPAVVSVAGSITQRGWDVSLDLPAGQVWAVMGHNGAGKSTLAEVLAGRLALDSGQISIAGRLVDGPGRFVTARHRRVAVVSQQPRIFEHLTVLANVAYPLRSRGRRRAEAEQQARAELAAVGCAQLAGRRGGNLSGGQAARVALARALVFQPDLLILDEPTAALDVEATAQITQILRERLHASLTTTVLVTHDPLMALQLADHMVVLDHGRVVETGSPSTLLARPGSRFTARLAGLNIVTGKAIARADGLPALRIADRQLVAASDGQLEPAGQWTMIFPPEAVSLYRQPVPGSPRTMLPARVVGSRVDAGLVTVSVALVDGCPITVRITMSAWAELGASAGDELWCSIKATQVRVMRAES